MKHLATTFDYSSKKPYKEALTQARPDNSGALWYRKPEDLGNSINNDYLINSIEKALNSTLGGKSIAKEVFFNLFKSLDTGFDNEQIKQIIESLDKFNSDLIIPISHLKENDYLIEEFYGPTDAFKDIALQMLTTAVSIIMEEENKKAVEKAKNGEKGQTLKFIVTQTSTSGDTGPAGGSGIENKKFVMNVIGFPVNEATYAQKGQMMRLKNNVIALPMNTSFSKIQEAMLKQNTEKFKQKMKEIVENGLKDIISKYGFKIQIDAGSFNSVNPGRVDGQTIYHSYAILQAIAKGIIKKDEKIIEVIPSGNGGHMYSVLMAREQTGVKGPTIVTCNRNNMFYKIIEEGRFQKPKENTAIDEPSVSMIIEYPNNMIRLFSYAFGPYRAKEITDLFFAGKEVVLTNEERKVLKEKLNLVVVESSGKEELETIGKIFKETGILICPHTANAVCGLEKYRKSTNDDKKALISATASPWKFLASVAAGLSFEETDDVEKLYKEYRKLENSKEGVKKLLKIIEAKYQKYGKTFSIDILPENLRKIYENSYNESKTFSPKYFSNQTLKFLEQKVVKQFRRDILELFEK